jgi:NAD(P)-dependent dehydrogenase (short-subunit alcohol dehydrogenase family)
MINPMDLSGKTIMITGAGGGIGKVTSEQLSKLGAQLVLLDVFPDRLEETLGALEGAGHRSYVVNLKAIEEIEPLIAKVYDDVGTVDGFVHCAGIAPMRPFKMTKYEDILPTMQINFFSFVEIVRCITLKKRFANGGSIVAMSSTGSIHGKPTKVAYSASKAAIDAAISCMVCDLKQKKIRINSIMPSWVNTNMYASFLRDYPDSRDIQEIQERQYLGVSEPVEVANVIAFLLSDATKTITGTSILMDGGILQG